MNAPDLTRSPRPHVLVARLSRAEGVAGILEPPRLPHCRSISSRTLLIDDNAAVLAAAQRHGISQLLTVTQPDSGRPPRSGLAHAAFNGFDEIMPP